MRHRHLPVMLFTLAAEGLFLLSFLFLTVFGAGIYRETVETQELNGRNRLLLSYFTTCAKNTDTEDAVTMYTEGDSQVLSFSDGGSGYAVRVYCSCGKLLEDYGREDSPLAPDSAAVIGETEVFHVEKEGERTYTVTTDAGSVTFTLKSGAEYEG